MQGSEPPGKARAIAGLGVGGQLLMLCHQRLLLCLTPHHHQVTPGTSVGTTHPLIPLPEAEEDIIQEGWGEEVVCDGRAIPQETRKHCELTHSGLHGTGVCCLLSRHCWKVKALHMRRAEDNGGGLPQAQMSTGFP